MSRKTHDQGLDALLLLDGEIFFADTAGKHFVKFVVKRVEPSAERPRGLSYSLTLHSENGERLVGSTMPIRCPRKEVRQAAERSNGTIGIGLRRPVPTSTAARQR